MTASSQHPPLLRTRPRPVGAFGSPVSSTPRRLAVAVLASAGQQQVPVVHQFHRNCRP